MYPLQHHILIQLNNRLYLEKAIINFNVFVLTSSGSEKSLICESFYVIKPGIFITNIMGKRNLKIYIVNWTSWSKIYKRFSWPSLGGTIMELFVNLLKSPNVSPKTTQIGGYIHSYTRHIYRVPVTLHALSELWRL